MMGLKHLNMARVRDSISSLRTAAADGKNIKLASIAAGLLVVGVVLGLGLSRIGVEPAAPKSTVKGERKILHWVAPMNPGFRSDKPGKSPMGMDLIPVYEDQGSGSGTPDDKALRINPRVVNNIGVRTAEVVRTTLSRDINTIGFIAPDDDVTSDVHIRTEGWIEELAVKAEGENVEKDSLLFRLYSRPLSNAQAEFIQALEIGRKPLADAARKRLEALGMSARQIEQVGRERKVNDLIDIYAPQDGYVVALNVREGMFIQPNSTVFTLADLSSIWVMVEVYEDQSTLVAKGQKAEMRLPFIPGKIWEGTVDFVYPTIDPKSRTIRVRLKFKNRDRELKPNMYAEITIHGKERKNVLAIPREALIRTGKSERVILAMGGGRFRPAQVVSGMESGNLIEIVVGLLEGEKIVSSGQFLLDSEASLDASLLRMVGPPDKDDESSTHDKDIQAVGVVQEMKLYDRKLNISHDPIPEIGWPNMTMDFRIGENVEFANLKAGDRIDFTLRRDNERGDFIISSVSKTGDENTAGSAP